MPLSQPKNLFIRMDKIGDLVLSLNADQWSFLKSESSHWWITEGLEVIAEQADPRRETTAFSRKFSWSQLLFAFRWLKQHEPQRAIVFHAPWWVGMALWMARVPVRIGRLSQWHSFLFFNFGFRQKRSLGEMHESEYNFEILKKTLRLNNPSSDLDNPGPLKLKAPALDHSFLEQLGLKKNAFIVVHPGMAGSALNWPLKNYSELIQNLSDEITVAITGGPYDQFTLKKLKQELPSQTQDRLIWLDGKLTLKELLYVLASARLLIAPSTGVLHLAASLGTSVIGLYSPRRIEHPTRWGPRGLRTQIFVPEGIDRDDNVGEESMAKIKVSEVQNSANQLLNSSV